MMNTREKHWEKVTDNKKCTKYIKYVKVNINTDKDVAASLSGNLANIVKYTVGHIFSGL